LGVVNSLATQRLRRAFFTPSVCYGEIAVGYGTMARVALRIREC